MLAYNLSRTDFCGSSEWHRLLAPRSVYHSVYSVLFSAERTVNNVADTVNKLYVKAYGVANRYFHSVIGNEFRLGCHNSPSACTLRSLIGSSFSVKLVFNIRYNYAVKKSVYKGRFSRSYRAYDSDVDVTAGSFRNIKVYGIISHCFSAFLDFSCFTIFFFPNLYYYLTNIVEKIC